MGCWKEPTTKDAYRLSVASIIITISAAIAGTALYVTTGSSLCLVYGLENWVDFLSSAVVLWRFYAPFSLNDEVELKLTRREKRASVAISMILVLLGLGVILAAAADLARGQETPEQQRTVIALSFFSIFIFGVLAVLKFKYSVKLSSASLYKDGVCSLIGTILSVGLFIDTLIIRSAPDAWWIDPVVAMGAGLGAIIFGLYGIFVARYRENLPIFKCGWWFTSQGSEGENKEHMGGDESPRESNSGRNSFEIDTNLNLTEEDEIV